MKNRVQNRSGLKASGESLRRAEKVDFPTCIEIIDEYCQL